MLRISKTPLITGAVLILLFPVLANRIPAIDNYPDILVFTGIYCLITIGLNLLMGFAGQISLGHAAFFGIGAYVSGILTTQCNVNAWLAMLCGALICTLVAIVVGAPSLKLKGHYLAMATLAFGIIVHIIFREEVGLTGGPDGMIGIPGLSLFGYAFDTITKYYYLVWFIVGCTVVFTVNLIQSPVGRALRAIHGSEPAASAMGVSVAGCKILAFIYSAVLASCAGSLYAHYMNFINPSAFDLFFSIKLIIMIALGGIHSIWGALIGTILITFLSLEWLHFFQSYEVIIYGAILLLVTIYLPSGMIGLPRQVMDVLRRRT